MKQVENGSERDRLRVLIVGAGNGARAADLPRGEFELFEAPTVEAALDAHAQTPADLIVAVADATASGLESVRRLSAASGAPVVALYPGADTNAALAALRAGASDAVPLEARPAEIALALRKMAVRENLRPEEELRGPIQRYSFASIIAQSAAMKSIFETVKRLSQFNTTVLITGESGTGKELLAKAIHHNSPRRGKPFVAVNCGAIPETLIESELFGHKRGSFTDATKDKRGLFEEANGGTIFLDEIGELPLHLQVKLLRVLQEQQIRRVGDEQPIRIEVRVIAATLRDLERDVSAGRFRDDLFYRLNVVALHLPSLRERPEDIPVLVDHFLKKHNKRLGTSITGVAPEAMRCLLQYHWRGNVRELENCIERALVLAEGAEIDLGSLAAHIQNASNRPVSPSPRGEISTDDLSIKRRTRVLEEELIGRALQKTKGNRTHAAKILEISHRALLYKLKEYGMSESEKE